MRGHWTPFLESGSVWLWFCQCLIPNRISLNEIFGINGRWVYGGAAPSPYWAVWSSASRVVLFNGLLACTASGSCLYCFCTEWWLNVSQLAWKHFIKMAPINLTVYISETMSLVIYLDWFQSWWFHLPSGICGFKDYYVIYRLNCVDDLLYVGGFKFSTASPAPPFWNI